MIIDNLDIASIAFLPYKTDAVLIVNPHTVLSRPVAFERFKPVTRQRRQITQCARPMNRSELPARHIGDVLKPEHRLAFENRFGLFVPEPFDHR